MNFARERLWQPVEALCLAAELPWSRQRDELVGRAVMEWASLDIAAAEQWARGIGDVNLRAQVLSGIAMERTEPDIQSAVTLAVSEIPPGRIQADALVGIAGRWVQVNPEAAAAWVAQFPVGDLRRDAVAAVAAIWSLENPTRAHEWQGLTTEGFRSW